MKLKQIIRNWNSATSFFSVWSEKEQMNVIFFQTNSFRLLLNSTRIGGFWIHHKAKWLSIDPHRSSFISCVCLFFRWNINILSLILFNFRENVGKSSKLCLQSSFSKYKKSRTFWWLVDFVIVFSQCVTIEKSIWSFI